MKSNSFVGAFGGVVLLGAAVLPADALAFGPQWRPAPVYGAGVAPRYQRVANVPTFRPSFAKAQRRAPDVRPRISQRAPRGPQLASSQPRRSIYRGLPQPRVMQHGYGYPGMSAPRSMAMFVPPAPYPMFAQGWQPPAQMFAPQFAGRPVAPGWVNGGFEPPRPFAAPRYGMYQAPPATAPAQRPAVQRYTSNVPMRGGWRPVVGVTLPPSVDRYQPAPPVNVWAMNPVTGTAVVLKTPQAVQSPWRSSAGGAAMGRPVADFRPSGYGRSRQLEPEVAARDDVARGSLPGWATTYSDDSVLDGCTWCSGS